MVLQGKVIAFETVAGPSTAKIVLVTFYILAQFLNVIWYIFQAFSITFWMKFHANISLNLNQNKTI